MNEEIIINILSMSNYIILNKTLIKKIGILEAVFLSELIDKYRYFYQNNQLNEFKDKKWFFFTKENVSNEVDISQKQQISIIKKLRALNLIETTNYGIPCKRYFSINFNNIANILQNDVSSDDKMKAPAVTKSNDINNNKYNINKYNNIYSQDSNLNDNNQIQENFTNLYTEKENNINQINIEQTNIDNQNIITPPNSALPPQKKGWQAVIEYLNEKTGYKYQNTEINKKLIEPKIKQYGLETIKQIIEHKVKEWKNTEWQKYLRPRTLFSSKIEDYYNQMLQAQQKRNEKNKKNWIDWKSNL